MFLKAQGFKKLINEAYKGPGLRIGNDGEGYYIAGGYWAIWIKEGWIPKKELGAIIELTGELPGRGESYEATKAGNQYELRWNDHYSVMENAKECTNHMAVTPVTLKYADGQQARILQDCGNNQIILINERFIDMIDNTAIEYEKNETQAEGPLIGNMEGVFWKNETMALCVMPRRDEGNEALIGYLKRFDIMKGRKTEDEH